MRSWLSRLNKERYARLVASNAKRYDSLLPNDIEEGQRRAIQKVVFPEGQKTQQLNIQLPKQIRIQLPKQIQIQPQYKYLKDADKTRITTKGSSWFGMSKKKYAKRNE